MIAPLLATVALLPSLGSGPVRSHYAAISPVAEKAATLDRRAAIAGALAPLLTMPLAAGAVADVERQRKPREVDSKKRNAASDKKPKAMSPETARRKASIDKKKADAAASKARVLAKANAERDRKMAKINAEKKREADKKAKLQALATQKEKNKLYAIKAKKEKAKKQASRKKSGGSGFLGNLLALGAVGVTGLVLLPEPESGAATTTASVDTDVAVVE